MAPDAMLLRDWIESELIPGKEVRKGSSGAQVLEFQPLHRSAVPASASYARPAAAPLVERRHAPAISPELRRCENFFFAFGFRELISQATRLIEQNTPFGDAYAYRCFALLGEIQQGCDPGLDHDLVDLLRDYFCACERPIATEGATVCRLFLKLVFGDLVKRIARAEHGAKFCLQKTDPLCGGAFAVLEGDFRTAKQKFDSAIGDPASRAYAWAGIGLLNVMHSDLSGALGAFTSAGIDDEDVLAMSQLLRH